MGSAYWQATMCIRETQGVKGINKAWAPAARESAAEARRLEVKVGN
jgi:hypothetical protein